MIGKSLVDHCIIGMKKIKHASIGSKHFSEKSDRFFTHIFLQGWIEFRVGLFIHLEVIQQFHA